MPDIDHFLKSKSVHGRYQDSGDFTVSPEKALEKVREFNFARPYDWVLALIQAGHLVLGGARRMDILGSRKEIKIHLHGVEPDTLKALYPLLLSFEKTTPALEAFRRCAWGLLNTSRFTLRQGDLIVHWAEESLTTETAAPKKKVGEWNLVWEVYDKGVEQQIWRKRSAMQARIFLDIKSAVEEKAYHSTVPVLLDRRSIRKSPNLGGNSPCSPLVVALGKPGLNTGQLVKQPWNEFRLLHSEPLFEFEQRYASLTLTYCCRLDLKPAGPGHSLKQPTVEPTRSSVRLNKNGVLVYQKMGSAPTPISCHIIANCNTLRTDITGLAAREEDALQFLADPERKYGSSLNEIARKLWKDINRAISTKPFIFDQLSHPADPEEEAKNQGVLSWIFTPLTSKSGSLLGPLVLPAVRETKDFHLH